MLDLDQFFRMTKGFSIFLHSLKQSIPCVLDLLLLYKDNQIKFPLKWQGNKAEF